MVKTLGEDIKKDPSDVHQEFTDVSIRIFCCRYWILDEWECNDLRIPFWRIYHNSISGSTVFYKDHSISLDEDTLLLIPPNTSFSSRLKLKTRNDAESIQGKKFTLSDNLEAIRLEGGVDHFFLHFTLGFPLDFVQGGIYKLSFNNSLKYLLMQLKAACIRDTITGMQDCLRIKQLIAECLLQLPNEIWKTGNTDPRIIKSIKFIEGNFADRLSNQQLAETVNMATNSFARLFKTNTGLATHHYIMNMKVQAAIHLLHHTHKSIDEISFECGFSDRHHFSKMFKKVTSTSPSRYKKKLY